PAAPSTIKPPVTDDGIWQPLDLAAPNNIRRPDGAPGAAYWQQRADYTIRATLDTASKSLSGTESIRYTNNSPDTLRSVWMQLDQNLFRPGSVGSMLNASESRFGGAGFQGGFEIESITEGAVVTPPAVRKPGPTKPGTAASAPVVPLKSRTDDTMMEVELAQPLPPRQTIQINITYHFNIPEHGADRMGRDGTLYELAQWYPRMAVYDDVHGWNTLPYLGQGEFYLEYGDFNYEVTVPAGYIVAGSGTVQNPTEVLTATQRARLAAGVKSDSITHVVTADELTSGAARPAKEGTLTWKFKATSVRDVAWCASPDYLWDVSGWDGVLAQAYYRPSAVATWKDGADMARASIKEYSTRWMQYPYPQISAVEGPVSGMEYPMVAMEAKDDSKEGLYAVITHEIGHMWYPMVVGSDERRYAWMDEGFNTFINIYSEQGYFTRDDTRRRIGETRFVMMNDQAPTAQPIMTYANLYKTNGNLGSLAYVKPGLGLFLLREKVLGHEVFDASFREYTSRWAFKHPQPSDFFRSMEDGSGRDLDWFWRGWFYSTGVLDQSVESVKQTMNPDSTATVDVTLRNLGTIVMPVELQLTFKDGTTQLYKYPVEIWYKSDKYVARINAPMAVTAATVNPDGLFPDFVASNNAWAPPAPATP
ncbi:MAG: M1 family metallopeptidase, partial [Gemmatimonadales bacterium]